MKITQTNQKNKVKIKRVFFWRLFWFAKLNIKIHKKDPIFRKAQVNFSARLKFFLSFSWKIFLQTRFILLENGHVAGTLSLDVKPNSVFVYAVGLLEEYRRKGYGSILMKFTEDFAKKRKIDFVNFSVLLDNEAAIGMYNKLGYESQGIGLTLIRYIKEKLVEINTDEIIDEFGEITFRRMIHSKEIKSKSIYWWSEEIEAFAGQKAKENSIQTGLLDFDFRNEWKIFEILTNNKESGIVAILPSGIFLTLVFFSDPKNTWSVNWTKLFIHTIVNEKLGKPLIKNLTATSSSISLNTTPLIQVFLTNQHKDALVEANKSLFIHDSDEDRQIFFKKLD